jgi:rare lipoprotein A
VAMHCREMPSVRRLIVAAVLGTSCGVLVGLRRDEAPVRVAAQVPPPLATAAPVEQPPADPVQVGTASFYGHWHHGRLTASGERFDLSGLTAAHRTLPFGTVARVTDVSSGRSVTVRITDRGPYLRGRVIDLSYAAAQQLGMVEAGLAKVRIEVLGRAALPPAVAAG